MPRMSFGFEIRVPGNLDTEKVNAIYGVVSDAIRALRLPEGAIVSEMARLDPEALSEKRHCRYREGEA